MNTSDDLFTAVHRSGDQDAQQREQRAPRLLALGFSVCLALGVLVWLIVSSSVTNVSAAAGNVAAEPAPLVPYFPSLYVNRATDVEAAPPPTF